MRSAMRAAREAEGYSQAEVAGYLGITPGAVSQWETGEAAPTAARLVALAELYGRNAGELLAEDPPPPSDDTGPVALPSEATDDDATRDTLPATEAAE